MFKGGDFVEIVLADETVTGHIVPSPQGREEIVILKLSSGYNIVLQKNDIKSFHVLEKKKSGKPKSIVSEQNLNLPKVTLLHTGGTIAARVDYRLGAVLSGFITAEELLSIYPELKDLANVSCRMVSNIASEDMRFGHYNLMLDAIKDEIEKGAKAIIIPHGTDTMHYTAAALSFGLENLSVPVILVGSQRSSDRGSSDAFTNLYSATYFATKSDFAGVAVCMHYSSGDDRIGVYPAFKVRKMHTSRRDAFRPINSKPIAIVDTKLQLIDFKQNSYTHKKEKVVPVVKKFDPNLKIGFLKAHPNMFASEVQSLRQFDGVVIEGTGLGHIPNTKADGLTSENARVFAAVEKIIKGGVLVAVAPQTLYGRIQMNVYTPLRRMRSIGILGHLSDMTSETTFVKLAWLLSNYPKDKARELVEKNLRGEISSRLELDEFLN